MKVIFKTWENWLLIVPLLIWILEKTIVGISTLDIHLNDTYIVFTNISIGIVFLATAVLPFICHVILRNIQSGKSRILFVHVLLTCVLTVILFCFDHFSSYSGLAGMPRPYSGGTYWNDYYLSSSEGIMITLLLFYVLLQLLLLLYTFSRLLKKK